MQGGLVIPLFRSTDVIPLEGWAVQVENGYIKRISDPDLHCKVIEIHGISVQRTYISAPNSSDETLGVKLPVFDVIMKNIEQYVTIQLELMDNTQTIRKIEASNRHSVIRVKANLCRVPLQLVNGWNQVQVNLSDVLNKAYGTSLQEVRRVVFHANCRLRRILFMSEPFSESQLPLESRIVYQQTGSDQ